MTNKQAAEEGLLQEGGLCARLGAAIVITTAITLISSYFNIIAARCVFIEAEFLISIAGNIFSISPLYGRQEWKEITSEIIHFCHDTDFYFPLGPFKICVLQSVSKTNSGQDLLHTDEL